MKRYIYILLLFILFSCKSWKKTNYDVTYKISQKKLIKELNRNIFSSNSFESKIDIFYQDNVQQFKGVGKIRIRKDSIIWGSINFLGIPVVKFMITPHRIQYYNKIEKNYYDGNFDLIRKTYGIDLNFKNLQNLLLGDLIMPIENTTTYKLHKTKFYYLLQSKEFQQINDIKITPFFKILSERLSISFSEFLTVKYSDYQKNKNENIPHTIEIRIKNAYENYINLKLKYKQPVIDKKLRFPFNIPESFNPAKLSK